MTETSIFLFFIIMILFFLAHRRGEDKYKGFSKGAKMLWEQLPLLILAFFAAGFLQTAVPSEIIQNFLGEEAGFRAIILGSAAGAIIPAGPYISFPIIASLYKAGAGVGTTVAMVTGWAAWGISKLPFELALMGYKFTLIRIFLFLIIPPAAGILAHYFFSGLI